MKFADRDNLRGFSSGRFVRSALLRPYAEAARAVGLEPTRMIRRAGLPLAALQHSEDPLPAERLQRLIAVSAETAECDHFGLLVGLAARVSDLGAVGLLAREQSTIRAAFQALADYGRFQNNTVELRLEPGEGALHVAPALIGSLMRADDHLVDLCVGLYVQVARGLLGDAWRPAETRFTRAAPPDTAPYVEAFGPVGFGGDYDGFAVSDSDLDTEIPNASPGLARELAQFIERRTAASDMSTAERVAELVARLLPTGGCTVEQVALFLGSDRRTLHRRLSEDGQTFTGVVQQVRVETVARRLAAGGIPLGELAQQLGFSGPSAFARWFKQTYGVSARAYRAAPR